VPRIDGDWLYGRGSYDMKAGLAAALLAARDARALGLAGDVVVAAVSDEEDASTGIQDVLRTVSADAAIVTEPTELDVVVAHKGFVWSEIEVTGRAAHGSRPALGVDAIVKTGPVLVALADLDAALSERTHPLLGRGSLHAGRIDGGRELSSYPERCVLRLERRTLPGESVSDVERELDELLARCRDADPDFVAERRTLFAREPLEVDAGHEIVLTVRAAAAAVTGAEPAVGGASYWADSGLIAAAGIPTVLFGPGGEGAHAVEERVSLCDTEVVAKALVEVAARFCR
jgi:acetylornithine deacetylase